MFRACGWLLNRRRGDLQGEQFERGSAVEAGDERALAVPGGSVRRLRLWRQREEVLLAREGP
ncbi:MAG: hypothetical protein AVDCRST_MAG28-1614 [uncultured Rubrobacteraceae bacterium]|uniref:Uncharacterized protein n=1 Tax=uncultured Rubrobacteraceae bacterium TaxID=349277 RepID=A0A6J4Q681_9ACTN|nr:MAG: hypothetical protein AVDCRST_MAG28-1614 [uncultured Rubrobacteraceae bacterium]